MITGEQKDYTFYSTFQSLLGTQKNIYGETFVKYLDPINLKEFLSDGLKIGDLNYDNFDNAALQLTEHLLTTQ